VKVRGLALSIREVLEIKTMALAKRDMQLCRSFSDGIRTAKKA
jgi:hypothetical protein